jgi:antitoxin YefM
MREVRVSEARDRWSELIDEVRASRDPVTLTRHGRPAAVLVDPQEWALASAALEAAEDAAAVREYDAAKAVDDGTYVTHEELLAELVEDERRPAG